MKDELIKVQDDLKIPLSTIIFRNGYIVVYSSNKPVGNIPTFYEDSILQYDINEASVNALNWNEIYSDNKRELLNLIKILFDNAIEEDRITCGTFRKLYVRQDDQSLRTVECIFENDEWKVALLDY